MISFAKILSFVFLAGCVSAPENSTEQDSSFPNGGGYEFTMQDLEGRWETRCNPVKFNGSPGYGKQTLRISKGRFTKLALYSVKRGCSELTFKKTIKGSFGLGPRLAPGTHKLRINYDSFEYVNLRQTMTIKLNADNYCGVSGWGVNIARTPRSQECRRLADKPINALRLNRRKELQFMFAFFNKEKSEMVEIGYYLTRVSE